MQNSSIKNMKEALKGEVSYLEQEIKECLKESRDMKERLKSIKEEVQSTQEETKVKLSQLQSKVTTSHGELNKAIGERIDNLIENNLKIPGIIDDPEGKDSTGIGSNLKDYILENVENNNSNVVSIRVSTNLS